MNDAKFDEIRQTVREKYGEVAVSESSGCGCSPSCCGGETHHSLETDSGRIGYSAEEVLDAPAESNMGLGCGNPVAIASLKPGETVLDLGSGGGFDCFLASRKVGDSGKVIGVDMTPEMISKARKAKAAGGYENVEFRMGEIEHIPVADNSVDVIISNCVINLSPDKPQVFRDIFRVLKPGGRIAVSDIVATSPLSEALQKDVALYVGCVAGAMLVSDLEAILKDAGFKDIKIALKENSKEYIQGIMPGKNLETHVASAYIEAVKP